MKITPSSLERYKPRITATYVLLSPRIAGGGPFTMRVAAQRLRAEPLLGQRLISKEITDGANLADIAPIFVVSKGYSDGATVSDTATFVLSAVRTFSENVAGSDILATEGAGALSLTETASTSDSGAAFIQGYVDNTGYFAEDYVGLGSMF